MSLPAKVKGGGLIRGRRRTTKKKSKKKKKKTETADFGVVNSVLYFPEFPGGFHVECRQ